MEQTYTVQHNEHSTNRSYDEALQAFESRDRVGGRRRLAAHRGVRENSRRIEQLVHAQEGSSSFMRFLTIDHGWMARYGSRKARSRMYTIGNPLIAQTMLRHSVPAGLNVPVRILIYEDIESGTTRFAYDLPSSLMSVLKNDDVTAAARLLDAKLIALARLVMGTEA